MTRRDFNGRYGGTVVACDWDGVILDTEWAKRASWLLPALHACGKAKDDLMEALSNGQGIAEALALVRSHPAEMEALRHLRGQSRRETAEGVCRALTVPVTPAELTLRRNRIRSTVLDAEEFCKSIAGAVAFLECAHAARVRVIVVTQTTTDDVLRHIERFQIPNVFSSLECAGDSFYSELGDIDAKGIAYAIGVIRQGARTDTEAVAIEDSASGVRAAKCTGIHTIGVSSDDPVPGADLNVHPDLGALAREDIVNALVAFPAQKAIDIIAEILGK